MILSGRNSIESYPDMKITRQLPKRELSAFEFGCETGDEALKKLPFRPLNPSVNSVDINYVINFTKHSSHFYPKVRTVLLECLKIHPKIKKTSGRKNWTTNFPPRKNFFLVESLWSISSFQMFF